MLEKLKQVEARFSEIESKLTDPAYYSDPAVFQKLCREQKELQPVVETYRAYQKCGDELEQARMLLSDPELHDMAQEEFETAKARRTALEQALRLLLLPRDPNDERNVILEIRSGVGGEESALFAHSLYRMYTMYADAHGWKTEVANLNETELGGIREASVLITGAGAYSRLKFESGVHRVQRVPETEAGGRIHTSTATVAVLPELDEVEFHIDPKDLQIDTYRSSGAGGQHVNKTESAIRITHLPTGTVVECQDERSQYKNKDRAMKILASRLYAAEQERQNAAVAAQRRSQVGTGMRNERIRTYNFPQGRVTDHRIGLTLYKIDQIMNGDLDEIMDALITADQAEKLRASVEEA
ncbi:MAG: peptide chain release factor 1 [Oscillospiraceae bacterium]|nr:peptide chain release factor 1 [Oscillospiraceae bacterium]